MKCPEPQHLLGLRLMAKRGWMLTLIQASDESVQRGLLHLLNTKYASQKMHRQERSSFFGLKGILKSKGNTDTDKKLLDDYLKEKV